MSRHRIQISAVAAVLALTVFPFANAADKPAAGARHYVAGEKLDSGLGKLPPYSQWAKHPRLAALVVATGHVSGERLERGLGELPHYSHLATSQGRQQQHTKAR